VAFWDLGIASIVVKNAPKYRRIIEPYADNGTLSTYLKKKPPKEHVVNIVDEVKFGILTFIQGMTGSDKAALKSKDWVASPETFDQVVAITAVDGPDLFYRFFYMNMFAVRQKDPEAAPLFDWLKFGSDGRGMLFKLPTVRVGLKRATITNEDPLSVLRSASGADTFALVLPSLPEDIEAAEAALKGISSPFFFSKKSKSNDELLESVKQNSGSMFVSSEAASTIMMATLEIRTNYEGKLKPLEVMAGANDMGVTVDAMQN